MVEHKELIDNLDGLAVGGTFTWANATITRTEGYWELKLIGEDTEHFERPRVFDVEHWKNGVVYGDEIVEPRKLIATRYHMTNASRVTNGKLIWQS